jgi:hypothetical protein
MHKGIVNTLSLRNVPPTLSIKRTTLNVKYWWLIIISVLLRCLPFAFSVTSSLVDFKRVCIILSYTLLLFALLRNIHIRGVRIIAFGTLFNFIGIIANLGFMPVSPDVRYLAGKTSLAISPDQIILTASGGIILPFEKTELWFFTDIIPVPSLHTVFSIGDVIICVGILVVCINLIAQAVKKTPTPILNSSTTK